LPEHSKKWIRETIGYRKSASIVKISGRLTMPWMSRRCLSGSMSGTPLWLRSKCRPLGVSVPSSASSGVRAAPLPVVPGCDRIKVRVTLLSCLDGTPYSLNPAPGDFIHGGTSGGSNAPTSLLPLVTRPLAPSSTTLRLRNLRLDGSIVALLVTDPPENPSKDNPGQGP